jgi:hypothetical protein
VQAPAGYGAPAAGDPLHMPMVLPGLVLPSRGTIALDKKADAATKAVRNVSCDAYATSCFCLSRPSLHVCVLQASAAADSQAAFLKTMADSQARMATTQEAEHEMAKEMHQSSLLGVDKPTTNMNSFRQQVMTWSARMVQNWLEFIGCSPATLVLMAEHMRTGTSLYLLGQVCIKGFYTSETTISAMQAKYNIKVDDAEKLFMHLCNFQDVIAEFNRIPKPAEAAV